MLRHHTLTVDPPYGGSTGAPGRNSISSPPEHRTGQGTDGRVRTRCKGQETGERINRVGPALPLHPIINKLKLKIMENWKTVKILFNLKIIDYET